MCGDHIHSKPQWCKAFSNHRFIVGDFSRGTWTFLMQSKNESFSTIKNFLAMVKTQYASYFKKIRSDNALEFLKSECNSFFRSQGTTHETSYVYAPQHNGIVEGSINMFSI